MQGDGAVDLDELERLARRTNDETERLCSWTKEEAVELWLPWIRSEFREDIADFVLAASPDVVLAIIARVRAAEAERDALIAQRDTPEIRDFVSAVIREADHQRARWGEEHDAEKTPAEWFWLLGYLGGKALHALTSGDREKGLHHIITTAAALSNWHRVETGRAS